MSKRVHGTKHVKLSLLNREKSKSPRALSRKLEGKSDRLVDTV